MVMEHVASSSPCTPVSSTDNALTSQPLPAQNTQSASQPMLVNSALSFIKTFLLKSDKDTLKRVVADRLPLTVQRKTCGSYSDKRSQLSANIDDIIQAFDALDSSESIPSIYCEANDLLFMPPLCLDPTAEQVQQNTKVLLSLVSQVENLEKKLPDDELSYLLVTASYTDPEVRKEAWQGISTCPAIVAVAA